ncbi:MAG: pitrilysin family protein [Myxococcota bacterium]
MQRHRFRGFGLIVSCVVAFATAAAAIDDPAARTQVTTFDNGLVAVTLEDDATPVVSFQIWVQVGSRDESEYTGLAHLFEHMMFKGSKHIAPEEHARLVNARGGVINAFTSRDFTVYFEDVTRESLPLVIDLEHERFSNLRVTEDMLKSERQVVLEERRYRTEDKPVGRAYEALLALLWQAHPYRWPVIGWRSDVEKATVEVCQDFFDRFYAPNNLVIAVAGDFDTEATLAHLERTFGQMPNPGPILRNPTEEPEQSGERRSTVHFDLRSPVLAAAWHAPPTGHEDGEALDVLSQILSDGRSSRLYKSLVHEAEIALSASGGYWEMIDAGAFLALAGVRPGEDIDEVERLFFAEIDKLRDAPVTEAELAKAKRQLEVSLVNGLATSHALSSRIGRDYATFGRIRPLDERLERIRSVTAEDVQRVARTYLVKAKRNVVHIVPPPEEAAEAPAPANARDNGEGA